MRRILGKRAAALLAGALFFAGASSAARADQLSADEVERLGRGETVVRPQVLETGGRRYVGGVTYTLVDAVPADILAVLDDPEALREVLPKTKYAERLARRGEDLYVELHQGNALVDAAYTLHFKREPDVQRVRFWMDLSRPHDIADAWGFFRYEELVPVPARPRLLLVYGAVVDLGDGMLRSLYEERVARAMLTVPQRVRDYVARPPRRDTP